MLQAVHIDKSCYFEIFLLENVQLINYSFHISKATSSLDNETEQFVQESMLILGQARTMVVIAHRLSTVQDADIIYVLEQGRVAEQVRLFFKNNIKSLNNKV